MNRTALIATALAAFLCAGTVLAQTPDTSTPNIIERVAHAITPEDILGIRDLREVQLSPDGERIAFVIQERAHQLDLQKRVMAWFDKHLGGGIK